MVVDVWAPLRGLGEGAERVERALGRLTEGEVERVIVTVAAAEAEAVGASERAVVDAAEQAARFALRLRGGHPDAVTLGAQVAERLRGLGDERGWAFVEVERAAALAVDKARLAEAEVVVDALPSNERDAALAAAVHRARGALARARADLRGSLLELERARALAVASESPRETMRACNTLGTSYAALGVAALARDALETARELAEPAGQMQSAAIASGQLAVLALDAERPTLAVRLLETQRAIAVGLGDAHGEARALALLVEAHAASHDTARARACADASRELYARGPTPWARLQALMATMFETELALSAGDRSRARELQQTFEPELLGGAPMLRVARARRAFVLLWGALLDGDSLGCVAAIERGLGALRASLRPTWVERALSLSAEIARRHGRNELALELALRASSLVELRGAASSPGLTALREVAPEAAVARAMAFGRDLLSRARLCVAPLEPFQAELIELEVDERPGALDAAILAFDAAEPSLGDASTGPLVQVEGPRRALVACSDEAAVDAAARRCAAGGLATITRRARARVRVRVDPTIGIGIGLVLVPA